MQLLKSKMLKWFWLLGFLTCSVAAKEYFVADQQAYQTVLPKLVAGDTVVLKNGVWRDFEILFEGQGTAFAPIKMQAETKGKVILSGQSNLKLAGKYLQVSGLVFKQGYTPTSAVIAFRRDKDNLAFHSRVTEVVIDNYNNPDKQESDHWVALYGQYNRFDHNHLVGKRNKGVTVAVRLNSADSQNNYHQIDHNYFGYRPVFGSNGGETLRIGTSHFSLTDSHTLVENNYFEQTNGEVEIISVKSGKNILRGNVFYEARGTLTLRHGNGNLVEDNIFIGNGVDHTGGIRVINKDQIIRNNYLEGLTGYRFGSGFTIMNGVPDSPINRYHQVENARVEHNSFINVQHLQLAAGSDAERRAVPINSQLTDNLVFNEAGVQPFTVFDDVSGIQITQNVANSAPVAAVAHGFEVRELAMQRLDNGLLYPLSEQIQSGVGRDLKVLKKSDVGVGWYPKTPAIIAFDSGKAIPVSATPEALMSAVVQAESGDTLLLEPGAYIVPKLITIDKTLTIKAKQAQQSILSFERSSLFEIRDGGNLKLDGLTLSGVHSPDAAGNTLLRSKKWGMVHNYRLQVLNCVIKQLNVNHSFDFFATGKGAFADEIILINNDFSDISGNILRLNSEIEDLGIYNAEYVTVQNNRFRNVAGAIAALYRGGTDESTFGPHFTFDNNQLKKVGFGKRNKQKASVFLHGVQVANITASRFEQSAPIVIEHTVGEPKSRIVGNEFITTDAPEITELRVSGPHTAVLEQNQIVQSSEESR
ncbi:polysaccharide lyase 6 family protein [Planctobacterium marinum]|uniref:Alginate lyase n=1 Tax=Planctobacterium marinum TaxID=1631968 RepID=A0AA48KNF0_9ALTE|nr:hypothetical protein MACH26_09670 [Planctobacterium marinum]